MKWLRLSQNINSISFNVFLALADGLCCAWLVYPIVVLVQVSGDIWTSSIDLAQMSSFHRIQSPKFCVLKNKQEGVFR
jgi:hypothetical protein